MRRTQDKAVVETCCLHETPLESFTLYAMSVKNLYDINILEMARIACASIPEDLCKQMDLSDSFFVEIKQYIQKQLNE